MPKPRCPSRHGLPTFQRLHRIATQCGLDDITVASRPALPDFIRLLMHTMNVKIVQASIQNDKAAVEAILAAHRVRTDRGFPSTDWLSALEAQYELLDVDLSQYYPRVTALIDVMDQKMPTEKMPTIASMADQILIRSTELFEHDVRESMGILLFHIEHRGEQHIYWYSDAC